MFGKNITVKVLGIIGINLTLGFLFLGILALWLQSSSTMDLELKNTRNFAAIIVQNIKEYMMKGDSKEVNRYIAQVKENTFLRELNVYGSDGKEPDAGSAGVANPLILHALQNGRDFEIKGMEKGIHTLSVAVPLQNEKRCKGCHDAGTAYLGGILLTTSIEEGYDSSKKLAILLLVVGCSFFFLMLGSMYLFFKRSIINPIKKGVVFAQSASKGNLSEILEVTTEDEIGNLTASLNSMVEGLTQLVGQINRTATELNDVSANISEASKQVFNAAHMQAEDVNTTSTAMSQINASIKGVARGMDNLSLSASESSSSILELAASVEEVAVNAGNLATSVEEVSSSICEMATSIKQVDDSLNILKEASTTTASSVSEMDGAIKQVEINASEIATISDELRRDAETGKNAVDATINGINGIKRSSGITSEVITNLSTRAEDIGNILSVIDEVTQQTNLLSLNAAIIAAQAGEHGKGFSIVSNEIKELAKRTAGSTREIARVITGVQEETRRAVEAINQAEKSIMEGELLSQKSGEALNKVLSGAERATRRMGEIARATAEQSKGSQMIRDAMNKVSEMVEQIVSATREQRHGSEQIMAAAERMKDLTLQVKTSTREQSKVGSLIANSTENITGMIQRIKYACDEQSRGSEQIVAAVENIQHSTRINLEATKIMNESAASLSGQVGILQNEMSAFTIADSARAHRIEPENEIAPQPASQVV
jgi:methyl-accepting chemotaxis protein